MLEKIPFARNCSQTSEQIEYIDSTKRNLSSSPSWNKWSESAFVLHCRSKSLNERLHVTRYWFYGPSLGESTVFLSAELRPTARVEIITTDEGRDYFRDVCKPEQARVFPISESPKYFTCACYSTCHNRDLAEHHIMPELRVLTAVPKLTFTLHRRPEVITGPLSLADHYVVQMFTTMPWIDLANDAKNPRRE